MLDGTVDWADLIKPYNKTGRGARGRPIVTYGYIHLECIISGRKVEQDFVLADISEPLILGLDFIVQNEASWDWRRNMLVYQNWDGPPVHCFTVQARTSIQPAQVTCLRVIVGDVLMDGTLFHVKDAKLGDTLTIQDGVSIANNGEAPLWIENTGDTEVILEPQQFYTLGEEIYKESLD